MQRAQISSTFKIVKDFSDSGVIDRLQRRVGIDLPFGDISHIIRPIDQDVIPRLVSWWIGRVGSVILLLSALKAVVHLDNDTSITILFMDDQLTR